MVVKTETFRMRCTPYERELISLIRDVSKVNGVSVLSESAVVMSAVAAFANKYVPVDKLKALQSKHGID